MKYYEVNFTISAPEGLFADVRDVLTALAGEAGFESFEETADGLVGYIQQDLFRQETLDELLQAMPFEGVHITNKVQEAADEDWNAQWEEEGFEPIVVDERCVVHDGRHLNGVDTAAFDISVEIDAKLAFGTGTHQTTRMMISALLNQQPQRQRVLDCGCGTGILGIVALKAGASHCASYDIDEWSTDNTRHNAIINGVDANMEIHLGDASVLNEIDGTFDLVMANINRNILLNDMAAFKQKMNRNARLLLSGFYQQDIGMLQTKAADLGLAVCSQKVDGDWACLTLSCLDNQ